MKALVTVPFLTPAFTWTLASMYQGRKIIVIIILKEITQNVYANFIYC